MTKDEWIIKIGSLLYWNPWKFQITWICKSLLILSLLFIWHFFLSHVNSVCFTFKMHANHTKHPPHKHEAHTDTHRQWLIIIICFWMQINVSYRMQPPAIEANISEIYEGTPAHALLSTWKIKIRLNHTCQGGFVDFLPVYCCTSSAVKLGWDVGALCKTS